VANLNIAFQVMGLGSWTVGSVYLKNLFFALRNARIEGLTTSLLVNDWNNKTQEFSEFVAADKVIQCTLPRRGSSLWLLNGLAKRLSGRDTSFEAVLKKNKINAVFGPGLNYRCLRIASLTWLADFQHMRLPQMFSEAERIARDKEYLRSAKLADRIILISEAVKNDFAAFAPQYLNKVRVIRPVCSIADKIYGLDLDAIVKSYNLPEKFVFMPNQFYKHKNHEVALRALKILKERGIDITLVCTGNPNDYRHSAYFSQLCQKISQWGIRDSFIYLGLIPYEQVLVLIRQSVCVLSTSLFEGWGYTIEEARAVGKKVLVSDIPAHREQGHPKSTYFNPLDAEGLADKLSRIWQESSPGADVNFEQEARRVQSERLRIYAESFFDVVKEAVNEKMRN
jgi:glycosyltransferase involved in cell wall biosynthesis